jgi:isoleucyl-tRNA synthetase
MKAVADALTRFTQEDIARLENEGNYTLLIDSEPVILQLAETEIGSEDIPGWMVAGKDRLTVALDVTITPDLLDEGNARELVNRIQKIRKDNGFELTDRILVQLTSTEELSNSLNKYKSYICAEILADKIELVPQISDGTEIEVNDIPLKVLVTKNV